ncbi:CidA/LrgA family protein [Alphaproteobacteria bacterium]|nr:CidA/LrgA family protein [Alphaproteobacteria bacterium]
MLKSIFIIFFFQLIGEFLQKLFTLTLPGPVIGMILLLSSMLLLKRNEIFKNKIETPLVQLSEVLTSYLPLLFVPVGVGVVMHLSYLKNSYLEILLIILVSTLLTIGFTAFVMNKLSKKL